MEYWDAYNENRKKLGYDLIRDVSVFKENEYHIVEEIWIINSKGEILLTQRSKNKKSNPLKWECTAGSILKGETSYQGALRELKEEIGLNLNLKDLIYFGNKVDKTHHAIVDKWVVRKDINLSDLVFSDGEVQDAKYVTKEEFERMLENGEIRDIFYYKSPIDLEPMIMLIFFAIVACIISYCIFNKLQKGFAEQLYLNNF